jgi:DNA-binding response OmpR family regulator
MVRVLLIEDHKPVIRTIKRGLETKGFAVDIATNGEEGDAKARAAVHDIIIFDLTVAKVDAPKLLQSWRRNGHSPYVLTLTPKGYLEHEVLDLGADDYLTKPFEFKVLLARLRALERRCQQNGNQHVLRAHDLEIDTTHRMVKRAGRLIHLTKREFAILEFLGSCRGNVVSRSMIREHLQQDGLTTSNIVEVYIHSLRNKIDRGYEPQLILTRWKQGYLLRGN